MSFLTYNLVKNETFVIYSDSTEQYIDRDFTITEFNSVVNVNTDSRYSVNEKITVVFNRYGKLGIYRELPVNSGEKYRNIEVVTNSSQDSDWMQVDRYGSFIRLALGYEDESTVYYPEGTEITFELNYDIIIPETDNINRVYLNITGNGWRTNIEKLNAKIILPSNSIENTELYVGKYGETVNGGDNEFIVSEESGRMAINVKCNGLEAFEGATIVTELPNGTMSLYDDPIPNIVLILAAVVLIIVLIVAFLMRDKSLLTPVTNYYPPKWRGKELSPVEIGVLIDGSCDNEDISSLIFYWASKGYLAIENIEKKSPTLIKLRDLNEGNAREKALFDAIFSRGDKVSLDQLTNRIYTSVDTLRAKVTATFNKMMYKGFGKSLLITVAFSLILSVAVLGIYTYCGFTFDAIPMFFIGGLIAFFSALASSEFKKREYKWTDAKKNLSTIVLFAAGGFVCTLASLICLHTDIVGSMGQAVIPFVYFVIGASFGKTFKRTEEYNEVMGNVVGFRNFLMLAEKDRLESLIFENPEYYYNILPYAQVLGVSEVWTEKFKSIPLTPPPYIYGYNGTFNYFYYYNLTRAMNRNFSTVAVSRPASSGKSGGGGGFGGFGGGGFSGGGFGGGGGGSR